MMVDTQFNVFEILRIAEEVERKGSRFYLRAAERCANGECRSVYYGLADWRARRRHVWERIRQEYSDRTGDLGRFDPDDYLLSNPQAMAGLTCFASECIRCGRLTGLESPRQILRDAIGRAKAVMTFYHGLKGFTDDPQARILIDAMIAQEARHIRLLNRSLERGTNDQSLQFAR